MEDLCWSSPSAPRMVLGRVEECWVAQRQELSLPCSIPDYLYLKRIYNARGLNTQGILWFWSFISQPFYHVSLSNMCTPQAQNLQKLCIKNKESREICFDLHGRKISLWFCMEDFSKEKRMFSHWQILSSCVSNETEGIESLVHFFVSTLLLLMAAKKNAACLRGSCLLSLFSIGMVDYACHTPLK